MVAGGISFYGLSDLIILNGTMNEFAYSQALYYYKENYELFFKKNSNIYFEQDGARAHTSKKNKELIKQLFGDKFIQNAPNSPDLAYPIETLWAELKKRVKSKTPKNEKELKKIVIQEWNAIPVKFIKNQFKNFIKRCEKVIELKGGRLEPVHLNQIRKEEEENEEESEEEEKKNELKLKMIFNEQTLKKTAKKEIAFLRKKIKEKLKEIKAYHSYPIKKMKDIQIQNYSFKIS